MSEPPRFIPPKSAESLLRHLVGGRDVDAVAGDLRETFDARGGGRLWYWRQVLSCLAVRFSLYRRALPGIGTDFSRALRRIRRNPGYAVTAMLCLALALGVNTTLFSFLDSMYFRKLPVPEADRIVQIHRQHAAFSTWQEYLTVRDDFHSVQAAAVVGYLETMEFDRTGFNANAEGVSSNYPQVLRLGAALGTWFGPDSDSAAVPALVISYRLWKTRFAGDPGVLGKEVRIVVLLQVVDGKSWRGRSKRDAGGVSGGASMISAPEFAGWTGRAVQKLFGKIGKAEPWRGRKVNSLARGPSEEI
jgi:hypothetical protein